MGDLWARMKVSHYSTDRQKAKDDNQRRNLLFTADMELCEKTGTIFEKTGTIFFIQIAHSHR